MCCFTSLTDCASLTHHSRSAHAHSDLPGEMFNRNSVESDKGYTITPMLHYWNPPQYIIINKPRYLLDTNIKLAYEWTKKTTNHHVIMLKGHIRSALTTLGNSYSDTISIFLRKRCTKIHSFFCEWWSSSSSGPGVKRKLVVSTVEKLCASQIGSFPQGSGWK